MQLLYYCLLAGTAAMSCFYIFSAFVKRASGQNPYYLKQWFGLASVFVLAVLYKAYESGEIHQQYITGLFLITVSWLFWGIVLMGFLILAKIQGRI